jgi:hypothetical protein
MPFFRKKPVVIKAEQWFPDKEVKGVHPPSGCMDTHYVVTIHGAPCPVEPGCWIIPEPDGVHFYPVTPQIFEATYEAV